MIKNKTISILIDLGASLSYVSPSIAEICNLNLNKFEKTWLAQLATWTKRKVVSYVEDCEMFMSQFKTKVKLNVPDDTILLQNQRLHTSRDDFKDPFLFKSV